MTRSDGALPNVSIHFKVVRVEKCACGQIRYTSLPVVAIEDGLACDVRIGGYTVATFDRLTEGRRACELACALYDVLRGVAPGVTTYQG